MLASSWARSSLYMREIAERGGEQPRRLRRQIEARGIGAAHDQRQPVHRRRGRGRTPPPWCRRCISRRDGSRTRFRCRRRRPRSALPSPSTSDGRHVQEHRFGIDEAADQPGAGDAVDLGPRPRDPDRAARRRRAAAACRRSSSSLARGAPGEHAAFQGFRPRCRRGAAVRPRPGSASAPSGRRRPPGGRHSAGAQAATSR